MHTYIHDFLATNAKKRPTRPSFACFLAPLTRKKPGWTSLDIPDATSRKLKVVGALLYKMVMLLPKNWRLAVAWLIKICTKPCFCFCNRKNPSRKIRDCAYYNTNCAHSTQWP